MAKDKTTPEDIAAIQRRSEAIQLRSRRWTYRQIADKLYNGDPGNCYRDIQKGLQDAIREPSEEVLAQEIELLDDLARAAMDKALEGDEKAITSVLKIMERRAKYLGLDKPAQTEITGAGGFPISVNPNLLPPQAVAALQAEAEARAAETEG